MTVGTWLGDVELARGEQGSISKTVPCLTTGRLHLGLGDWDHKWHFYWHTKNDSVVK